MRETPRETRDRRETEQRYSPGAAFSVLIICTGNICRSPAAERLLQNVMPPQISVTSAGTRALEGQQIYHPMASLLLAAQVEIVDFHARQLTSALLDEADLILTLTRGHRATSVELSPQTVRRTFTLLEFARLLLTIDPEALKHFPTDDRLRAAASLAALRRRAPVGDAHTDDVVDPYGGQSQDYTRAFRQIQVAVSGIDRVIGTTVDD